MNPESECREFVSQMGTGLQRALVAGFGQDLGQEAMSEALAYGWEHWDRVRWMENKAGYLYRVGYRWAIRAKSRRGPLVFPEASVGAQVWVEPELPTALRSLSERQRTAVVLIEAYGWTYREVADLMGLS